MAGTSAISTLFKLWVPNDLMAHLKRRAEQSGASKAQIVVDAMREAWDVPEPVEPDKRSDKAA